MPYAITGSALVLYLVLAWFSGSLLRLQGGDLWILRIGLSLVGIIGAATYLWFYRKEHAAQDNSQTPKSRGGSNEVDALLKHADAGLAASRMGRGAQLRNLPTFLVLGDSNGAKTTTIAKSGLEPELLAGQIYTGTDIIPTQFLNCWLMQGSVFLEPGSAVHSDPGNWSRLIGRLRPRTMFGSPAPRAVLLCFPVESLRSTGDQAVTAARKFRGQLEEFAQTLGSRVPTYVVFTKLDQIEGFTDYMAHFTDAEVEQVLGATLPLTPDQGGGLYAERMTQAITTEFQDLVMGLSELRIDLLQRQREMSGDSDPRTLGGIYEFPREFRKIRDNVVQFLVELCRPSQLRIGPFLRGFYFCGVRPVTSRNAPALGAHLDAPRQSLNATSVFRPQAASNLSRTSQPTNAGPSRIPQWIFLYPIFSQLLLKDHTALGTSRASNKAGRGQRIVLAAAAALALIAVIGMAVSFFGNQALLSEVTNSIALVTTTGKADAARSDLAGLDSLSQVIRKLEQYDQEGPPWRLRWGLYIGHDAYTRAFHVYSSWFDRLLLQDIQRRLRSKLAGLPSSPTQENDSSAVFAALKAHLLLTSERSRAESAFLSNYLFSQWTETHRSSTPEVSQLVKSQFEFFAQRLNSNLISPAESDASAVQRARRYLRDLGSTDRIYQAMLAEAGKNNPPIQFSQRIPGSGDVIQNNYVVNGSFTKAGWKVMQEALQHPGRYSTSELWVMGQDSSAGIDVDKIRSLYISDYKNRWRGFLKGASVVGSRGLNDTVTKLSRLQSGDSPLLALFFVVSENTAVGDMDVKRAFQAVQDFVLPNSPDKYVGPANMGYMMALADLATTLEQLASMPPPLDPQLLSQASSKVLAAKTATRLAAQNFAVDSEANIDRTLKTLIEQPIIMAENALRSAK